MQLRAVGLLLVVLVNPCSAQKYPYLSGTFLDAAFNAADGRLYAVTGAAAGGGQPEIQEIDPATASILARVSFGSSDARVHLSPDGKYLYVSRYSDSSLVRFQLPGLATDKQFSIASPASAIAVSPIDAHTFAIVTPNAQGGNALTLYRNDVPLPGVVVLSNAITDLYFDSADQLYGVMGTAASASTDVGIQHFTVGPTGLAVTEPVHKFYLLGIRVRLIHNLLFTSNALVVDPNTWQPVGRFFPERTFRGVPFDVDPQTGTAYYIRDQSLLAFATQGFQLKSSFTLDPPYSIVNSTVMAICGPNLLAIGSGNYIFFVPKTALLQVAPTTLPTTLSNGVIRLLQPSNAIAFDSSTQKAYLAISGLHGPAGNSVFTLDANSLAIGNNTPVGSEPNVLALSSTGQTLQVGLQGTASVATLSTASMTSRRTTRLTDAGGYLAPAVSLAAVPGSEDLFVSARDVLINGIGTVGTLAFEGGNLLPDTSAATGRLFPGSSPGHVYQMTDQSLVDLLVSSSGLSIAQSHPKPVGQGSVVAGGQIFDPQGRLYTFGIAQRQGVFASLGGETTQIALNQDLSHIYIGTYYQAAPWALAVLVVDRATLLPVSSYSITVTDPLEHNQTFDLIQTGNGLLFRFPTVLYRIPNSALTPIAPIQTSVQPAPGGALTLSVPVNNFIVVPGTHNLMFTVSLSIPGIGGRIGTWNTDTNQVTYSGQLGGELAGLAISGDGSQVWVSDLARQSVRVFSLPDFKSVGELAPDPTYNENLFAADLKTVPGAARSLFVSLFDYYLLNAQGALIFDGAQPRAALLPHGLTGDFNGAGDRFYGFVTADTGFQLSRFSVDPTGFHLLSTSSSSLAEGLYEQSTFQSGLMYLAGGRVVDPERATATGRYDLFAEIGLFGYKGTIVLPDAPSERVYFLTGVGASLTLLAFDQRTFRYLGSVALLQTVDFPGKLAKVNKDLLGFLVGSTLAVYKTSNSFSGSYPLPDAKPAQGVRQSVHDIGLVTTDAVVDRNRGLVYAAIPSTVGVLGPAVVIIDPNSAVVQVFARLSTDPRKMALSDDGSRLYVVLQGTNSPILVLDTATGLVLRTLHAPLDFTQTYPPVLVVMAALPGKPDSLLTGWTGGYDYVLFDHDSAVVTYLQPFYGPVSIVFADPQTFAGLETTISTVPLYLERITSNGSISTEITRNNVVAFATSNIAFAGGKLFFAHGEVLDVSSLSVIGRFPVVDPGGTVLADLDGSSVYFVTGGSGGPLMLALGQFDPGTYAKRSEFPIPADGASEFSAPLILQVGATSFVKVAATDVVLFDIGTKAASGPLITAVGGVQGVLSPGAAAIIRGQRLSHYVAQSPAPDAWTDLAGATVLVNGERVYITSISPGEIRIILPADIPVGPASFQAIVDQNLSPVFQATVVKSVQASIRVVHSASFQPAALAPGMIFTVFGSFAGVGKKSALAFPLPNTIEGLSLSIGAASCPLLYVSATQVNAIAPANLALGSSTLVVKLNSSILASVPVLVLGSAPDLFMNGTHAAALNGDYTINSSGNPVHAGTTLILYATGQGAVNNTPPDGAPARSSPLSHTQAGTTATLGGLTAKVFYSGLAPGFSGLAQINILVPAALPTGDYPVQLTIDGAPSNVATVSVISP
jgi:uncharacterized protein (TIGR03437 family)